MSRFNPGYSLSSVSPTNSRDIFNLLENYSKAPSFKDKFHHFYKKYKNFILILLLLIVVYIYMYINKRKKKKNYLKLIQLD